MAARKSAHSRNQRLSSRLPTGMREAFIGCETVAAELRRPTCERCIAQAAFPASSSAQLQWYAASSAHEVIQRPWAICV